MNVYVNSTAIYPYNQERINKIALGIICIGFHTGCWGGKNVCCDAACRAIEVCSPSKIV